MGKKFFLFILVLLFFSLMVVPQVVSDTSITGDTGEPYSYYDDEKPGNTPWSKIKTLFDRIILKAVPGSLLLLFFSVFFSSINFYGILPQEQQSLRRSWKYLFWWVTINFVFAMIFLLLILPDDVTLTHINKKLLLYCLVATALPELSANIKLQFGKSEEQSLNLYKYKNKVATIIAKQLNKSYQHKRNEDIAHLSHFYTDRLDHLKNKLQGFLHYVHLSEDEKNGYMELLKKDYDTTSENLISQFTKKEDLIPSLLEYFGDDINNYKESPVFKLMSGLHPILYVQDTRKLVEKGIVNPRQFVRRTMFKSQREKLFKDTQIDINHLNLIHFSTRKVIRKKRFNRIKAAAIFSILTITILFLIYNQTYRTIPNYDPPPITNGSLY